MTIQSFFIYLLLMAGSTYLIRVIPFVLVRHQIENRFIRSFLHSIPYAVLTAMTISAIFPPTSGFISASTGFAVAIVLALLDKSLTTVALLSCLAVYITELIMSLI